MGFERIESSEVEILERHVASGTEKVVRFGRWRGQPVALLEVLGGSRDVERSMQCLVAEHPELSRHPHVVRVLGETEEGVLVNEWSPLGSMTNYDGSATAFTRCRLPSTALADIASQVASAAHAFWTAGYVLRDLAARNVLVFSLEPPLVKLTDFGVVARRGLSKYDWPLKHAMGTRWMAPESQPEQGFHFDEKTDIYTFGCFLYELCTGRVPLGRTENGRVALVKRQDARPWADEAPQQEVPEGFWRLMELCCERLPGNRPSFGQLMKYLERLKETSGASIEPAAETGPWTPSSPLIRSFDEAKVVGRSLAELQSLTQTSELRCGRVHCVPLFSEEICTALLEDLVRFHASGRQTSRANSNNRFCLRLSELGYEPFLSSLVEEVASPLFARLEGWQGRLVYRHGHTVQRVHEDSLETSPLPGSNRGSLHTDDSDVTINVNIGGCWEGGGLKFFEEESAEAALVLPQARGQAFLHKGSMPHQAGLLSKGYRFNLVIWASVV